MRARLPLAAMTYKRTSVLSRDKLSFMDCKLEEKEIVPIFIKGLQAPAFQPLQLFLSTPKAVPDSLDELLAIVRKFAATPAVALELGRMQSRGFSHAVFNATAKARCHKFYRCQM